MRKQKKHKYQASIRVLSVEIGSLTVQLNAVKDRLSDLSQRLLMFHSEISQDLKNIRSEMVLMRPARCEMSKLLEKFASEREGDRVAPSPSYYDEP